MCSECQGYSVSRCPICGDNEQECPSCNGLGHTGYYAFNIITREEVKCTEETWLALPVEEDDAYRLGKKYCQMPVEPCGQCGGEGYILG